MKPGDRVALASISTTASWLWGAKGTLYETCDGTRHSEGHMFLQFDEPVENPAYGFSVMRGCWVEPHMVEVCDG